MTLWEIFYEIIEAVNRFENKKVIFNNTNKSNQLNY